MANAIKLRGSCKYSLLIPTSMGTRLTAKDYQPSHCSRTFELQATSAESNVGSVSAFLGLPVCILTAIVSNSPFGTFIKRDLMSRGITVDAKEVKQDGPWGVRHQINIADTGVGSRGPSVGNDRAGEVGRTLRPEDFDLETRFGKDGVEIVHSSGLVAALSPDTGRLCREIARTAKKHGSLVSFDLNHRASFWKGREKELAVLFKEIASCADILVGNEEDFQLCLGIQGPPPGGKDLSAKIESFKEMIDRTRKEYPNAKLYATTLREVESANLHHWGAIMWYDNEWYVVQPRPIGVIDRIGGGDAFVGGMLYGVLRGWEP
ncbi:MAG TPA: sugar kinase, partial [Oligoflexia bacterium]|nr:sugar kinase [Oligoflexia bacterium]